LRFIHFGVASPTFKTWIWQLAYAILGLAFFLGVFLSIISWMTRQFWWWSLLAAGSIVVLGALNRVLHPRRPAHACPECGYDQSGLPSGGTCPECGTPIVTIRDERGGVSKPS